MPRRLPFRESDISQLLTRADIVVGSGYASGEEALAHVGLGKHEKVDLRITWGGQIVDYPNAKTDQMLTVEFPGN